MKKTLTELIDELVIVNIKIFMLNNVLKKGKDKAGRDMVNCTARRSQLKNAISECLGNDFKEVKDYED